MQRKRNEESQPIKKRRFLSFALEWQVETALKVYVILKGFSLKNLHPSEHIVRSLTYVRDDKRCHSDDRKEEESLLKWIWRRGFLVGLTPLLGITWLSFWTERSEVKNLHLMASGNSLHSLEMTIIWDSSHSVYRPRLTSFFLFAPRLCPNKNVLYGTWLGVASIRHIFVQERQWKIFLYMYTLEDRRNNFGGGYCYIQE